MKVKLLSNDKVAAEATDSTIRGLPTGGYLKRNVAGDIEFDEFGNATVEGGDQKFLAFALRNQGYVAVIMNTTNKT